MCKNFKNKIPFDRLRRKGAAVTLCIACTVFIASLLAGGCNEKDDSSKNDEAAFLENNEQGLPKDKVNTVCECSELPTGKMVWDYPLKPGTEEWKKLINLEQKIEALQIPKDILSSLSTEDLTAICVQYPLYHNAYAFNSFDYGLDIFFNGFNGLIELFKREDALKELLKYNHAKFSDISILDGKEASLEKGLYIISVSHLEALLSRCQSQNGDIESCREVLRCLVAGFEKKLMYPDYTPGVWFETNFFARAHMILKISPKSLEKIPMGYKNQVFLLNICASDSKKTMDVINDLSYQLIK
jgi:hypothetical protein